LDLTERCTRKLLFQDCVEVAAWLRAVSDGCVGYEHEDDIYAQNSFHLFDLVALTFYRQLQVLLEQRHHSDALTCQLIRVYFGEQDVLHTEEAEHEL